MNYPDLQSNQPLPDKNRFHPNGWESKRMRFWDQAWNALPDAASPGETPPINTQWLETAALEPLYEGSYRDRNTQVPWPDPPVKSRTPSTVAEHLMEMANSPEWDIPVSLLGPVSRARRAFRDLAHTPIEQQLHLLATDWPDVFAELRLYRRRRILVQAEQGQWSYQVPLAWPHDRFEVIDRELEQLRKRKSEVMARSYVNDEDPLRHPIKPVGLQSFLSHR